VSVSCAVLASLVLDVRGEQKPGDEAERAVLALAERGAVVKTDDRGRVVEISLAPENGDEALLHAGRLATLRRLVANDSRVTDAGLRRLAGLTGLEELWLGNTAIGDAGLAHLKNLPQLKKLGLARTSVTDAGLRQLAGLKSLTHLYLDDTKITPAALENSGLLETLKLVSVGGTEVTEADRGWFRTKLPGLAIFPMDLGPTVPPIDLAPPQQQKPPSQDGAPQPRAGVPHAPIMPATEDVPNLITPDGVRLAATYFPGTKGKDTVPVILLHELGGSGTDYKALAAYLQSLGHAVLVPDLRGHGGSRKPKSPTIDPDASRVNVSEFDNMAWFDMPTLKDFLVQKNNAGELNIEKLVLVGAEMGASIAVWWACADWAYPPVERKKQGQNVKAMVLISPGMSTPGLPITKALSAPPLKIMVFDPVLARAFQNPGSHVFSLPVELDFRKEVAVMILVGKESRNHVADARRIVSMFQKYHPEPKAGETRTLFYGEFDTSLQGTKLLGKGLPVEKHIAAFINLCADKRALPWAERTLPFQAPDNPAK